MKIISNLVIALLFYSCNSQTNSSENQLMKCIYENCLDDGSEFKETILKYENELITNKVLKDNSSESDFNVLKNISIDKGVPSNVDAILETDAGTLIEKGKDKNIEQTLTFEENISAPISKGQKLGEITFTLDGKILSSINIVAQNNVEKTNLFSMAKKIYYSWIDLLRS